MSFGVTVAVSVLALLCAAMLLLDIWRDAWQRASFGLLTLIVFLIILNVSTGFPHPVRDGSWAILAPVAAMVIGVVAGMAAQYAWAEQPAQFEFLDFLRPLVISPLLLLPLIDLFAEGSTTAIEFLLVTAFAFQSGFFWQQVLKGGAHARTAAPVALGDRGHQHRWR